MDGFLAAMKSNTKLIGFSVTNIYTESSKDYILSNSYYVQLYHLYLNSEIQYKQYIYVIQTNDEDAVTNVSIR